MLEQSIASPTRSQADESVAEQSEAFNWRMCWYPVTFLTDLPIDKPYGFSVYGESFVLFRDSQGQLVCLEDRCPHRAAKLSDGRVSNGRLECLYHGWQFGSEGTCLHIPHLPESAKIPARACAPSFAVTEHQGIVWMWLDKLETANSAELPTIPDLDRPGLFVVDTMTDLPIDQPFLVENLLDPAHVYISHDRTELKIRREDAQPLDMEVVSTSIKGIQGRFRGANRSQAPWTSLNFIAPNLVHYNFSNAAFGLVGGLALYSLPIDYGKSRFLIRRYGSFYKKPFTLKPRWLEHLRQNKILEEDLSFIVQQQRYLERSQRSLKDVYFPLKTCDLLVMEHRKWLDQFGATLPWYTGYATAKYPDQAMKSLECNELANRFERHTQHCHSCSQAYQRLQRTQKGASVVAIALLTLALLTDGPLHLLCTTSLVLAALTVGIAGKLKTHFEKSFSRT